MPEHTDSKRAPKPYQPLEVSNPKQPIPAMTVMFCSSCITTQMQAKLKQDGHLLSDMRLVVLQVKHFVHCPG